MRSRLAHASSRSAVRLRHVRCHAQGIWNRCLISSEVPVKNKRIAIIAALSLLVACGDSVTNVIDGAISGSLTFNYSGGGGGTFNANGGITSAALASSPFTTTWAAG